jgi:hypothetical protein
MKINKKNYTGEALTYYKKITEDYSNKSLGNLKYNEDENFWYYVDRDGYLHIIVMSSNYMKDNLYLVEKYILERNSDLYKESEHGYFLEASEAYNYILLKWASAQS